MKTINTTVIWIAASLLISCNGQDSKKPTDPVNSATINHINSDSVELTNLTRQVYEWHMTKRIDDFPYKFDDQQDSIFIGIDWERYQGNIQLIEKTNFFTRDFLLKHQNIASTLDSSIKKADITWRNINDGIPIWATNADDWCGCQDYPDAYWNLLTIDSLTINDDFADFVWTWDKKITPDSYTYKMTAKKEDGKWKINSLDGFKYYFSVDHYDNVMKE